MGTTIVLPTWAWVQVPYASFFFLSHFAFFFPPFFHRIYVIMFLQTCYLGYFNALLEVMGCKW